MTYSVSAVVRLSLGSVALISCCLAAPVLADVGPAAAGEIVSDLHGNAGYVTHVDPIQIDGKRHYRVEYVNGQDRRQYTIDAQTGELLY